MDMYNQYFKKLSLKNQNIIITGSCGLIGKEISKCVAAFEGNPVLADINRDANNQLSAEICENYNIKPLVIELDINSEDSVNEMIKYALDNCKSIDGLVNIAYPRNKAYGTKYENISFVDWQENIDLHLNGYFNVTHKVSKIMMGQNKGNIINMASIYGLLGPDFSIYEGTAMTMPAEYSAIKGGLINFTRYLATYLAKYNIRVNCISPGGIFDNQPEAFVRKYISKTPLGRMGNPEDIAGGVVYLLSELSSYVTGQNLIIDGGWSVW